MPFRVAVAGVTSGLGHAIVSGLLEDPGMCAVVLLTRKSSAESHDYTPFTSLGAEIQPTDYTSIDQLTTSLKGVDTVIVTILSPDPTPALNLLEASKRAGVRRFAPSEFMLTSEGSARLDLFAAKRQIWEKVKESGLEYTAFQNGLFADYLALGAPKPYTRGPLKFFNPLVVDLKEGKATIPGSGDEPVSFSTFRDVARFVAGAVKLEGRWPERFNTSSDTTTYNKIVKCIEEAKGEKMEVVKLDDATLKKMGEDKSNIFVHFYAQLFGIIADGLAEVPPESNNLVPQFAPEENAVEKMIVEHWKN